MSLREMLKDKDVIERQFRDKIKIANIHKLYFEIHVKFILYFLQLRKKKCYPIHKRANMGLN